MLRIVVWFAVASNLPRSNSIKASLVPEQLSQKRSIQSEGHNNRLKPTAAAGTA